MEEIVEFIEPVSAPARPEQPVEGRSSYLAAAVACCVAMAKSIRPPLRWAATQAQADYRFGLIKRGFFGATLTKGLHLHTYERFALFSFAEMAVFLLLLALLVVRSGIQHRIACPPLLILVGSSYAFTCLAQLNGYLDFSLAILTLGLLLIKNVVWRFVWAIPATIVGVLLHELFLLVFLPVILLSFLTKSSRGEAFAHAGRWYALFLAVLALVLTLWLASRPLITHTKVELLEQQIAQEVDFPIDTTFFNVLSRSIEENVREVEAMTKTRGWWRSQLICVLTAGPTLLLISASTWYFVSARVVVHRRSLGFCALAAGLSPLLMQMVGVDVGRWYALALLASFLVLLTLCQSLPASTFPLYVSPRFRSVIFVVMLFNLSAGGVLLGDVPTRSFPFLTSERSLRSLAPHTWRPSDPASKDHNI